MNFLCYYKIFTQHLSRRDLNTLKKKTINNTTFYLPARYLINRKKITYEKKLTQKGYYNR